MQRQGLAFHNPLSSSVITFSTRARAKVQPRAQRRVAMQTSMPLSMPPVGELPQNLWIFGYGSLIWKNTDVPCTESKVCFARGYKRRVWQGSTDHRGTVEAPGRVVSMYSKVDFDALNVTQKDNSELLPQCNDPWNVCGVAYKVTPQHRETVCISSQDAPSWRSHAAVNFRAGQRLTSSAVTLYACTEIRQCIRITPEYV